MNCEPLATERGELADAQNKLLSRRSDLTSQQHSYSGMTPRTFMEAPQKQLASDAKHSHLITARLHTRYSRDNCVTTSKVSPMVNVAFFCVTSWVVVSSL